jgi:hypothetical protein
MGRNAEFFTRVLADIFPGKPAASTTIPKAQPTQAAQPAEPAMSRKPVANPTPRIIGQGAANETHITIADEPNLFVEEADCVVQFKPAFDEQANQTQFGLKILPELAPHWSQVQVHRCSLKDAIATAIRGPGKPVAAAAATTAASSRGEAPEVRHAGTDVSTDSTPTPRTARRDYGQDAGTVKGQVVSWGEEKFPDRKKPGRFYESFAMHIDTATGERTLQGEGLKEAITESGCKVGDHVSVRRLRKIQVPAIRSDGSPKLVDGKQVMWDKWLWSISK